ncbi:alpha/beta hydrolase family protein [Campylobacter corcagiensis]|nr:alpha/beta fold hydrolase [Campylobacter corcagiensis]QKF64660.1 alpha/beta hydrolase family protein [Campylobacter corcagiensis]
MAIRQIKALGKIYDISYEIKNQEATKTILIIHGWGSKKEIMSKAFGSFLKDFKHIYIDLPGMGLSNIHTPLNTEKYAIIIKAFLSSLNLTPDIIMGHSFGGKISTLLEPKNLVLLSTAGIVEPKPFMVKFKIKLFKILKFFGFGTFYKLFATKDVCGMSRVMYETLKNVVDEDFRDKFANTKSKTLIFWGKNDQAVSVKSAELINRLIKNSEIFLLDGDHFFFLLHSKFIAQKIEESFLNGDSFDGNESFVFDPLDEISSTGDVIEREYDKKNEIKSDETISKELNNKLKNSIKKANNIKLPDEILKDLKDDNIADQNGKNLEVNSDDSKDLSDLNKNTVDDNFKNHSSNEAFKDENSGKTYENSSLFDDLDSFGDVGEVFERDYIAKPEPKKPEPKPVDNRKFRYQNIGNGVYEKIYEDMDGFSEQKIDKIVDSSDEYSEIYENFKSSESNDLFDQNINDDALKEKTSSFDSNNDIGAKNLTMNTRPLDDLEKSIDEALENSSDEILKDDNDKILEDISKDAFRSNGDDLEYKSRFVAKSDEKKDENDDSVLTFSEIFKKRFLGDDK